MANRVSFFLNGEPITVEDPPPDLLLIDFLRSPEMGLIGPKKGCGQGGCGACTVILSRWIETEERVEHRAINSCLRPVCALAGLAVTTVEGTGVVRRPPPAHPSHSPTFGRRAAPFGSPPSAAVAAAERELHAARRIHLEDARASLAVPHEGGPRHHHDLELDGVNPVAYELAMNNGSQCGYCSVGFVMTMSALLAANPDASKREIEDVFDGNICRCTGYRSILTGMKTFASDWSEEDEAHRMPCLGDDGVQAQIKPGRVAIPFPPGAREPGEPVTADDGWQRWLTASSLEELAGILADHAGEIVRLVHGNTSFGIYPEEFRDADVLVDIRPIEELYGVEAGKDALRVGAATTYSELIEHLGVLLGERGEGATSRLGAAHFMARRTAGTIVRNAATVAGNTMLVLDHVHAGEPFPSDLATALVAIGAEVTVLSASSGERRRLPLAELVAEVVEAGGRPTDLVLIDYRLPLSDGGGKDGGAEVVLAQKVALREVNSHSIVNATTLLDLAADLTVERARLVFGGIAPVPWRARETEAALEGTTLSLDGVADLATILEREVRAELARWAQRMEGLPSEGLTDAYRVELAVSFLYKAVVRGLLERDPEVVPPVVRSSGEITWGRWPVSDGRQHWKSRGYEAPVSEPYIKLMAIYQTSGRVHYTHELEVPPLTVNAAFVQSRRALADFHWTLPADDGRGGGDGAAVDAEALREQLGERFDAFIDLITCDDIPPGGVNHQGMGGDQPLFSDGRVSYVGQSLALVLADTETDAEEIADHVAAACVGYSAVDWPAPWDEPVLSLERAIELGSIFRDSPATAPYTTHVWKIVRPGSRFGWVDADRGPLERGIVSREAPVDGVPCQVVETAQTTGGQVHFYMETQSCVAEPTDGERLLVHPSSQSPNEMHQTVAMALGVEYNRVDVRVRQLGGGYGGKTEQARFVAGPTAVAANACGLPVRLVMPRDEDTAMIGKRHPYFGQTQIAIDPGEHDPRARGLIRGFDARMWGDGGAFYDCSFVVSNCIQLRADSAYRVPNFSSAIDVCRTNRAPNTAFRSFGDVQAKLIIENAVDDAAFAIGMTAEEVREKNLYQRGDVTPFGQALSYCYIREVWEYLKEQCGYEEKRAAIAEFNRANRWRKRGLAMIPVKYGSGYNLAMLEQAAAVVTVSGSDGTIIIHQGGVDMGQGMMTKVEQIASYVLNVPMDLIHVQGPDTSVIPNPTSTGGSTGTAYNGEAVKRACEALRERLTEFGYRILKEKGNDWCKANGIDFWNYGQAGWAEVLPPDGSDDGDSDRPGPLVWQKLIQLAYQRRVDLVSHFTAPIRGGETPVPAIEYKPLDQQPDIPGIEPAPGIHEIGGEVDSFTGFTYSAACSVVEVDILTGEVKILSSDLVYDMGWSLNPAIDVGQVEGAFVQGVGYVLTENLVFQPDGPERGRLNTVNTWRYKPPAITTIPLELNVYLFPRDRAASVPDNPNDLLSSKEVGEPPLVLANTVFFAVKAAIRASRLERGLDGLFRLDAPATVQEVRRACGVSVGEL